MHPYALLALEISRQRAHEADLHRLAAQARDPRPARPSLVRRGLANGFALVSLGTASITRRLDECVADDLGRSLAPTE